MGRTEQSATWIGQNVPAASRNEFQDFELEDLALVYGARLPTFMSASSLDTIFFHRTTDRDAHTSAASEPLR